MDDKKFNRSNYFDANLANKFAIWLKDLQLLENHLTIENKYGITWHIKTNFILNTGGFLGNKLILLRSIC